MVSAHYSFAHIPLICTVGEYINTYYISMLQGQ